MERISQNSWKLALFVAIMIGFAVSVALRQGTVPPGRSEPPAPSEMQSSSGPPILASGPQIEFATTTYNFRKIVGGNPVHHDFLFKNTGTSTLEITNVITSCGCATTGEWDRTVEPGETGKIPIELRTDNFNGDVRKSIKITTNVSDSREITLWIQGTVWQAIEINPRYAALGSIIDTSQPHSKTIRIVSHLEEPLEITKTESTNPLFRTNLKTIQQGKEFELEITANPPFNPGSHSGTIKLETSSKEKPEIAITASCYVPARVQFTPSRLLLPTGPLPKATERSVFVMHNAPTPLKILDVTVSAENITMQTVEMKEGKQFRIILSFPSGFAIPNKKDVALTFKTDDPSAPVVSVPIVHMEAPRTTIAPEMSKPVRSSTM